jgi:hypothetical protein
VPEAIFQGVKRPGGDAHHAHPSRAEVKNNGAIPPLPYTSSSLLLLFIKTANGFLTRWQLYYSKTQYTNDTHHANNIPHSHKTTQAIKDTKDTMQQLQLHKLIKKTIMLYPKLSNINGMAMSVSSYPHI